MGEKLVIGPFNRGLRNDVTPFNVDNDSFPTLINAYQWRGRVKRKRGTSKLNRLQRYFDSTIVSYNTGSTTILLDGSGNGNLLTGFGLTTLAPNASIVPGTVDINGAFTDPAMDGTLSPSGSINYATGAFTIAALAGMAVTAIFQYFPGLPVLGLEDLTLSVNDFPGTLAFDNVYSYNVLTTFPYNIYDVSFYKNPIADASLPGYIPKTNITPTTWNGQTYQQFWTVNYQGALWATNGINVPFNPTNVGMQFKRVTNVSMIVAGPPATARFTIATHGLVVGDFLFFNEFDTAVVTGLNWQTGYVINVVDPNNVDVEFPNATLGGPGGPTATGIAQYLTNRSDPTKDCLRWYDGDPTNGDPNSPILNGHKGWVNFAPPLSQSVFSIADKPLAVYYLVGARMIVPFKDRLLFIGPLIQSSDSVNPLYLQDTVIYSINGTPYYTASFTGNVDLPTTVFHPILVPINQTAFPPAYFEDSTGFGGFQTAGVDQPIITASPNEDVLILGFARLQTRFIYTGNDIVPFNFFVINSELGSDSTFSIINLDQGVMTRGSRGFIITSQTGSRRFDLEIPDQVFQLDLLNNGSQRFCAQRDFINEWVYFTYLSNDDESKYIFPNQTLQYNYRDESWAIFNESYTTYGQFRRKSGLIWSNVGNVYPSWSVWNDPWNAGTSTLEQTEVIAGNQQGFVIFRADGTGETNSLAIQNISTGIITCPDHCLNTGDYIVISGVLGTIGAQVNGNIFSVGVTTQNTFTLNPPIGSGTYLGGGLIQRMYVPFIQTKQFPAAWSMGRKTRIGPQQYLLSTTNNGQIQLLIFLSQDANNSYNTGTIVPDPFPINNSLMYSTVLYTCPESTNLGLTPANTNLQMPTALAQAQIWHRINTSLIGDTVQLGFTMSDSQMRDTTFSNQFEEIEIHGIIIDVNPSQMLS